MADPRLEYCSACGEPTGNAGAGDGSIFWLDGAIGPLCPECNSVLRDEVLDDANDVGEPSGVPRTVPTADAKPLFEFDERSFVDLKELKRRGFVCRIATVTVSNPETGEEKILMLPLREE